MFPFSLTIYVLTKCVNKYFVFSVSDSIYMMSLFKNIKNRFATCCFYKNTKLKMQPIQMSSKNSVRKELFAYNVWKYIYAVTTLFIGSQVLSWEMCYSVKNAKTCGKPFFENFMLKFSLQTQFPKGFKTRQELPDYCVIPKKDRYKRKWREELCCFLEKSLNYVSWDHSVLHTKHLPFILDAFC